MNHQIGKLLLVLAALTASGGASSFTIFSACSRVMGVSWFWPGWTSCPLLAPCATVFRGSDMEAPRQNNAATASATFVLMVVGVNGVGKTTSIAKLTRHYQEMGKKVMVAAGDTFRAAAIEQIQVWGERLKIDVIAHQQGSDPGAVAYDAYQAAKARDADVLIIDTAGRLHTKSNLMEELKKVKRVIGKILPGAPHQTLLVLDASIGQNSISQAKIFHDALQIDGLVMTKLDGTSKGGVLFHISRELKIPVCFPSPNSAAPNLDAKILAQLQVL